MLRKILSYILVIYSFFVIWMSLFVGNLTYAGDDIWKTDFTLDVNKLSPSQFNRSWWPEENINELLHNVSYLLLIIVPSLAVMFIVVWGIRIILAWWDSSKVWQWKTIINFNIIAVVISLLSYSIVQLTVWIIWWA